MENIVTYPNPQFERENWINLNGKWNFGFKKAKKGFKLSENDSLAMKIYKEAIYPYQVNVPFCIESELSSVGYKNFVNLVWYSKKINLKKNDNERIFLNIGAADYQTTIIVNSSVVMRHKGGYTPISADITNYVSDGENEVFILCEDDTKSPYIPSGKQSDRKNGYACSYTRTTGIWQSVYIQYVAKNYIKNFKIYPDSNSGSVAIEFELIGKENLECTIMYDGKIVGRGKIENASASTIMQIKLDEIHLWEIGKGRLYQTEFKFGNDKVYSYFGLRNIRLDGFKFLLNEKSVFQRLVLDQGYYKKGVYTAENDEEIVKDIELSQGLGFNGARLHQKVFDPRYLYFCDKMGYIVWGEYPSWGINYSSPKLLDIYLNEWKEVIDRDFNHPSIVVWCPFNETWDYKGKKQYDPLILSIYRYTKAVDHTRPCIDTSGNYHTETDIYDVHDYRYDVTEFKKEFDKLVTDGILYEHVLNDNPNRQKYNGEPVLVSEYGGIKWETDSAYKSWGYGKDVKTEEEFAQRYCGLTSALMSNSKMLGFCYTQLYDVEQEQNGLFTYERKPKFSEETYNKIRQTNTKTAEIEK